MDLVLQAQHQQHKIPTHSHTRLALPKRRRPKNPRTPLGATPHIARRHITILPKLSHCMAFTWRVNLHR